MTRRSANPKTDQKKKKISNLADRIKGLNILLTENKNAENNKLINKRIKGLEMLQKYGDDLPF